MKFTVADYALLTIMKGVPFVDGNRSIVRIGDMYEMVCGRNVHRLHAPSTNYKRLAAHWKGFCA